MERTLATPVPSSRTFTEREKYNAKLHSCALGWHRHSFASGAIAAPMINGYSGAKAESGIEQVLLACRYGRCNQSRSSRRVVIERQYGESYNYAPREMLH